MEYSMNENIFQAFVSEWSNFHLKSSFVYPLKDKPCVLLCIELKL